MEWIIGTLQASARVRNTEEPPVKPLPVAQDLLSRTYTDIYMDGTAEEKSNHPMNDGSMHYNYTQKPTASSRKSNHWWNNEIKNLRATCFRSKRLRGKPGSGNREQTHRQLSRRLKKKPFGEVKKNWFKQLRDYANINPSSRAYGVAMKELRKRLLPLSFFTTKKVGARWCLPAAVPCWHWMSKICSTPLSRSELKGR